MKWQGDSWGNLEGRKNYEKICKSYPGQLGVGKIVLDRESNSMKAIFISESERGCIYKGLAASVQCVQEERIQIGNKDLLRNLDFSEEQWKTNKSQRGAWWELTNSRTIIFLKTELQWSKTEGKGICWKIVCYCRRGWKETWPGVGTGNRWRHMCENDWG